ncbi:hypothetical protein ACE1B6_06925 [Aerosakkonemataceae cyanobacterium BLCC-F154]|uniref:Uncharacterized protein n=1 Tax=Floridaenema fluviatile BLCC-F154 TaxID=3153640 RepID=A0ABV4YAS6_9CYAN
MSETQPEQTTNQSPSVVTPTPVATPPATKAVPATNSGLFSNWKLKAGIIGTILAIFAIGIFTIGFYWVNIVATMGLNNWSRRANAQPIECMMRDTDNNGYVSCSAKESDGKPIALECGSSIFNIGCRVKVKMEP